MVFTSLNRPGSPVQDEEKYQALRAVLFISKFLIILQLIGVVAFVVLWVRESNNRNEAALSLLFILAGIIATLWEWASIQVVEVILDIEENTRRTADRGQG
jgi:flagellar biogenesis protein FliO